MRAFLVWAVAACAAAISNGDDTVQPVDRIGTTRALAAQAGYNAWPMLTTLGDSLVISYSRGSGHNTGEGRRDAMVRVSSDGGCGWTPERVFVGTPDVGELSEGAGHDTKGNLLFWVLCWSRKTGAMHRLYRSSDAVNFEQISAPRLDPDPIQVMDVVPVSGKGLFSLWFAGEYGKERGHSWGYLLSEDDGLTWRQEVVERDLEKTDWPTEQSLVHLGGGRLFAMARVEGSGKNRCLMSLYSPDGGKTWTRSRTSITDVKESTPALLYDPTSDRLTLYYFQRGPGLLKRRTAIAAAAVERPMEAWSSAEVVTQVASERPFDAGNVKAVRLGGNDYLAFYAGSRTNTTIFVSRVGVGPVAKVVDVGGVPRISLDGRPVAGTAVMPACKAPPGGSLETLRAFAAAGVRFSSDVWTMKDKRYVPKQWWLGEGKYDWALFDRLAHGLVDASSDGFIFPRIKIDPPDDWQKAHPEATVAGCVDCSSADWRRLYHGMLADMVAHVERSDYADRVIGYHVGALHCGEWHYPFWKPEFEKNPPDEARRMKHAEDIADAIIDSATVLKELTGGRKLVGAFALYRSVTGSHAATMRVLKSGKVDFFAAPPCYWECREPGYPGRSQIFHQASIRLHGGIYYEESDFRTYLSEAECAPAEMTRRRPLDESLAIMRRSIGKCLAGGWENWWFHLGGNATYSHPEMMATIRRGAELERETLSAPWHPAEVAVFSSIASTKDYDRRTNLQEFVLPCCGVPHDCYEIEDIDEPRLPRYRVCLALGDELLTPERRARLEKRGTRVLVLAADATADAIRETLRAAGAHVWIDTSDVLAAGRGFVMLHAASDGVKTVRLPKKATVEDIFGLSPRREGTDLIREELKRGETRVYRLMMTEK